MPSTGHLDITATVLLDINGNGTASIGPLSARERWHPGMVHVKANDNPTNEAQCKVYIGDSPLDRYFRDGTFSGSSGDSTDSLQSDTVECGQKIWAVWSGGDAGVYATLNITGTKDIQ